jgi:hypothetical protein
MTEEEVKEIILDGEALRADAADLLLERDKQRIAKLKTERESRYSEGYQAAEKKFKSHAEEVFKKKTGYNGTEDNFETMFDAWFEKTKSELGKKKEVTEDDIKRHPLFIDLESKTIAKERYENLEREFDQFKKDQTRQATVSQVTDKAWGIVAAKNPILSENPLVAENRKRDFLSKFCTYDYEFQDSKVVVLKDGKRLEDAHGNLKQFDAFVMELAEMNFDFRKQEDVGNAGNKNKPNGSSVISVNMNPKTDQEYNEAMDKVTGYTPEAVAARKQIHENFLKNTVKK